MRTRRPRKVAFITAGAAMMTVGFPVLLVPWLPLGAILIVTGSLLILRVSPRARLFRRRFTRRHPRLAALHGGWERVLKRSLPALTRPWLSVSPSRGDAPARTRG